jgi:hypothetical protein
MRRDRGGDSDHQAGEGGDESFVDTDSQEVCAVLAGDKFGCVVESADKPPNGSEESK